MRNQALRVNTVGRIAESKWQNWQGEGKRVFHWLHLQISTVIKRVAAAVKFIASGPTLWKEAFCLWCDRRGMAWRKSMMRQLRAVSCFYKVQTFQSPLWADNKNLFIYTVETCSRQQQRCNNRLCFWNWQQGIEIILRQKLVSVISPLILWKVLFLSLNLRPVWAPWNLDPSVKELDGTRSSGTSCLKPKPTPHHWQWQSF